MDGGDSAESPTRGYCHGDGSVRVDSPAPTVLVVELRGAIGLPHVQAMTQRIEVSARGVESKLSIFQDLTQVTAYDMAAQLHVSTWSLENAARVDRLHFAISSGASIIATIRAVVIALPIRAYMYRDRKGLDAAIQRALPPTAPA